MVRGLGSSLLVIAPRTVSMKETPAPQPESTERSREQLATEEDGRAPGGHRSWTYGSCRS